MKNLGFVVQDGTALRIDNEENLRIRRVMLAKDSFQKLRIREIELETKKRVLGFFFVISQLPYDNEFWTVVFTDQDMS